MAESEAKLSPRQIECLKLAADGKTSAQIGAEIGISPRTVDQYIGEACERLKVRNRVQAVVKAISQGLLNEQGPQVHEGSTRRSRERLGRRTTDGAKDPA
ncbi:MAG: hypothetical protein B7Y99_00160 [Caulobacterales bacterium 32-69-10]|nr:MAG: hypothetical protein B7Y99_00160 [Caulobacterales bacterium 32-69-10]